MSRRGLLGLAASLPLAGLSLEARAMGRVPQGGAVRLRVPWPTDRLDPHDLFDPLAAIFASAMSDPVYALDRKGSPYPTLADGMPRVEDGQTVVHLRPGLHSGAGRPLGGRDLAWSVVRARRRGAAGLLAELPRYVRSDRKAPLVARFGSIDPVRLGLLLSSPLVALLPVGFSPRKPDGTGPFVAHCSAGRLDLVRNRFAARGPSFLDRVQIDAAQDLAASLRAFEAGRDDIGWLGLGLHGPRPGAQRFAFGTAGWVVLVTGKRAGSHGLPGAAQQLANAVPIERMHVGLRSRHGVGAGMTWRGGPTELLYQSGAPALEAVATAVASKLGRAQHRIEPKAVPRAELRARRASGDLSLALDVVRHPGGAPTWPLVALATADRPALGRDVALHPPRLRYDQPAHRLTTTLRVGVIGAIGVQGGTLPTLHLAAGRAGRGFDLGASWRRR